jgi:hypothetical protein
VSIEVDCGPVARWLAAQPPQAVQETKALLNQALRQGARA